MNQKFQDAALEVAVMVEAQLRLSLPAGEAADKASKVAADLYQLLVRLDADKRAIEDVANNMLLPWA